MNAVFYIYLGLMIWALFIGALPAKPETIVYEYVDRHDTLCWTDDLTHVPDAYLSQTVTRLVDGLKSYPKYTRGHVEVTEE